MYRKNKCTYAVLGGILLLCLCSACAVKENSTDTESQKANDLVEHVLSSESMPSETDPAELQVIENTKNGTSSDTASKQDKDIPSGMEERYKAILLGDGDFVNLDFREGDIRLSLKDIKKVVSDEDWVTAEVTKFTIIDLDGNGENELVLWIQANGNLDYGFEILYYQDQEVYGFTLPYRGFADLKTDGTFDTAGGIEDSEDFYGVGRLRLSERGYTIEDAQDSGSQAGKTDATWYDLTADNVEFAFENSLLSS